MMQILAPDSPVTEQDPEFSAGLSQTGDVSRICHKVTAQTAAVLICALPHRSPVNLSIFVSAVKL